MRLDKGVIIKKVASFKKGRICKFPHCNKILNIYNSGLYCYAHQRIIAMEKPLSSSTVSKI